MNLDVEILARLSRDLCDKREAAFTEPPISIEDAEQFDRDRPTAISLASRDIMDVIAVLEAGGYAIRDARVAR